MLFRANFSFSLLFSSVGGAAGVGSTGAAQAAVPLVQRPVLAGSGRVVAFQVRLGAPVGQARAQQVPVPVWVQVLLFVSWARGAWSEAGDLLREGLDHFVHFGLFV